MPPLGITSAPRATSASCAVQKPMNGPNENASIARSSASPRPRRARTASSRSTTASRPAVSSTGKRPAVRAGGLVEAHVRRRRDRLAGLCGPASASSSFVVNGSSRKLLEPLQAAAGTSATWPRRTDCAAESSASSSLSLASCSRFERGPVQRLAGGGARRRRRSSLAPEANQRLLGADQHPAVGHRGRGGHRFAQLVAGDAARTPCSRRARRLRPPARCRRCDRHDAAASCGSCRRRAAASGSLAGRGSMHVTMPRSYHMNTMSPATTGVGMLGMLFLQAVDFHRRLRRRCPASAPIRCSRCCPSRTRRAPSLAVQDRRADASVAAILGEPVPHDGARRRDRTR